VATTRVRPDHPLVGTWEAEQEDSRAVFVVAVHDGQFVVTGLDEMDGEAFRISDGESLQFASLMPSTGHRARHAFRTRRGGRADHELTLHEVWKKRSETGR
jgi:hypothetical protein